MKKAIYVKLSILLVILAGIYYYATFPAINIHEVSFWGVLIVLCILAALIFVVRDRKKYLKSQMSVQDILKLPFLTKVFLILALLGIITFAVGSLLGSPLLRAHKYASLLQVEERDFVKDIEESEKVTDIALMDTESAQIFGDRKIGSLSDVVSQYEVESAYTQISIQKKPMKVSSLKYASFFKWWNNRNTGIPGYVKVNPVNSDAEYVKLKQGMRYVPSGYLNYNLQRHVQLKYPTKIIDGYHFEIDDNGDPFYICPTKKARVGLFGGMDVAGVIICDPVSGDCKYYDIEDCPAWVDSAYDGDLLEQKYNWHGMLAGGFINSMFSQTGCKQTTDDFGYKIIGDDVWIYTGVTSVNGDQSNIGFVMMNQRTSEARYYTVSGAEEHSAMAAAEGEVQEKGYRASFPSLINVAGVPTYIMVLKDDGGLVKLYAMVNVEQYNIVATAASQTEVFSNYKKLLASDGNKNTAQSVEQSAEIQVSDIQYINTEDGTVVYIKDSEHQVYKQAFKDNESLIKISTGDRLMVYYDFMEDGIHILNHYEFVEAPSETTVPEDAAEQKDSSSL